VSDRLSWENRGPGLAEGRVTAIAACRTCGTEPLEHARFCHGCGSPIQDGDARAEYKQVTVLFADVVHSMDIAAAVGAARIAGCIAEFSFAATVLPMWRRGCRGAAGDGDAGCGRLSCGAAVQHLQFRGFVCVYQRISRRRGARVGWWCAGREEEQCSLIAGVSL
jgi:class 3 adenylate cyclase